MRMIKPIVFLSRTAGDNPDPEIRDFRPANDFTTRTVEAVSFAQETNTKEEADPKAPASSATESASSSDSETSDDSTRQDETKSLNSSSESSVEPAAVVKANLLRHPSTKSGKIEPPVEG